MSIPNHIAIIMDGNGRWAKQRGLPRSAGHKKGADSLRETIESCRECGIKMLTVYAFSSENWKRPSEEVGDLMDLLKYHLKKELKTMHESEIRLNFIGNRTRLSPEIQHMLKDAEELTKNHTSFIFTTALSYGGRDEIARSVQKITTSVLDGKIKPEEISEEIINQNLDTCAFAEPDLLIRTGGEQRLSNFLLWQLAYTELYFSNVLWPDFSKKDLQTAINEFQTRERRYGNAV